MLTVEKLEALPSEEIFASGEEYDTPEGLFMANTGRLLRWVAVRGGIPDWTIYCHFAEHNLSWIKRYGDKVCGKRHIRKLVPCDDAAFAAYRY